MALYNDNIYVGNLKMSFYVLDRDFYLLDQKSTFTMNDISTFKASNESTFFNTYSSNAAVKAANYNQLRVNANTIINKLRTNGTLYNNVRYYFTNHPTVVAGISARADEIANFRNTIDFARTANLFKKLYVFDNIKVKVSLPATFNSTTLKSEFNYKNNISDGLPYYTNAVLADYYV